MVSNNKLSLNNMAHKSESNFQVDVIQLYIISITGIIQVADAPRVHV